jgi:diaminopimelate epimerase
VIIEFHKFHSSGSDYVIVDGRESDELPTEALTRLSVRLCDRRGAVGADGLIYVLRSSQTHASVRVFTPNGSEPRLCVNALLCAGRYIVGDSDGARVTIAQSGVDYLVEREENLAEDVPAFRIRAIEVQLCTDPRDDDLGQGASWVAEQFRTPRTGWIAADTGTPHLLSFPDVISERQLSSIGAAANREPDLFPNGINISLAVLLREGSVFVRTYERGGAGLSLSCATATMACVSSAVFLGRADATADPINAYTLGGLARVVAGPTADPTKYSLAYTSNVTHTYSASTTLEDGDAGSMLKGRMNVTEMVAYQAALDSLLRPDNLPQILTDRVKV